MVFMIFNPSAAFRIISLLGALLIMAGSAIAQPSGQEQRMQQLFNEGNFHYEQQDYEGALALYREIEASGFVSAELFLNTGLAYMQLRQGGYAMYYFTRARNVRPGWTKAREAMEFTRNWLEQEQGRTPVLNSFQFYSDIRTHAGGAASFLWALILLNAAAGLLLLYWFPLLPALKPAGRYGSMLLLAASFMSLGLGLFLQNSAATWQPGLVVESGYSLYPAADASAEPLLSLSPGSRIYMNKPETAKARPPETAEPADGPQWMYISHSNGMEGWVKTGALRLL